LDQKTFFHHIHTLFHPNLATSSTFFIEMENFWRKKITFIWKKKDIYVEMVLSGSISPLKKGLDQTIIFGITTYTYGDIYIFLE